MNISDVNLQIQVARSSLSTVTLAFLAGGFLLFLIILGILANVTVCVIMIPGGRFKKHLSNFMLVHLSMTDIVYRLIVVPSQLIATILPMQNKALLCKVTTAVLFSVRTAIFTSLVVIAFDRHHFITKPFQRLGYKPNFLIYILAVWGYSIACALPRTYAEGLTFAGINYTYSKDGINNTIPFILCSPSSGFNQEILATIYFILGFFLPLIIITVAYSKIAVYLWRKSHNGTTNQAALKSKGKALRMLVLLVLGFVVCFGVSQLKELMIAFGVYFPAFSHLEVVLQLSSSLVNALIYGLYSAEFKQGLRKWKK